MKCERIRELMSAYIDNEINEVDKAKFEKHLAQCPQCKEEYELLLDVVNECSDIDEVELPEDFREELHNKLLQAKEGKSHGLSNFIRRNRWRVYAGTTAAAVLIFALSLNALNAPKTGVPMAKSAEPGKAPSIAQSTAPSAVPSPLPSAEGQMNKSFTADEAGKGKADYTITAAPNPVVVAQAPPVIQDNGRSAGDVAIASEPAPVGDVGPNMQSKTFGAPTLTTTTVEAPRKIIKNGNIYLKVQDVQGRVNDITALANQMGGYVENSSVTDLPGVPVPIVSEDGTAKEKTTKAGSITIKVPADKFESTFQSLLAMGIVENQITNTNDITKEYMDLESRMNNLKIQEKSYQDLLAKAKTVEETLKIETEINRIRTEIDIMQGDIKRWNDQVEYSTIYINLTEVKEAELEKVDTSSVWHRARQGLINTLNNVKNGIAWLFVFIVSALPYILILGAGSLLAVYWIRRHKK